MVRRYKYPPITRVKTQDKDKTERKKKIELEVTIRIPHLHTHILNCGSEKLNDILNVT